MALLRPEDDSFNVWLYSQMYFGGVETGKQVRPNVNDMVVQWEVGIWRVTAVDSNGIPALKLYHRFNLDPSANPNSDSLLTSISNFQTNISTPIFYDANKNPQELIIEQSYPILEADIVSYTIFRGRDTGPAGEIVSHEFDTDGTTVLGTTFSVDAVTNLPSIKRPEIATTSSVITPGEQLTAVFFDSADRQIGEMTFTVYESASRRPNSSLDKTIVDISLDSDLIDPIDKHYINNDLNIPFASKFTQAIIHYKDGTSATHPIDGTKMILRNLKDVNISASVKPTDLTLVYYPDPTESFVNASGTLRPSIVKHYKLRNTLRPDTYGLKLFCIPRYIDLTTGYELNWMLVNLDRDVALDVTSSVVVRKVGAVTFDPTDYGAMQTLDVTLTLDDVAPGVYPDFVFTNRINIRVDIPHVLEKDAWTIDYNTDGHNIFGNGMTAEIGPGKGEPVPVIDAYDKISFKNDYLTTDMWLHGLYHTIEPLFDTSASDTPPDPTHFKFIYEGAESPVYTVDQFDQELDVPAAFSEFEKTKTVTLVWLLDTGAGYGVLGYSPLLTNDTLK